MKLAHLSDLHLGKRVNGFSMLDDQQYILGQVLHILDEEQPDGVLLAGDIYDKTVPPAEAVALFDRFLCALCERGLSVFVISGNHDSAERLAFGARLMEQSRVHIAPVYDGTLSPVTLTDRFGEVEIWLLPFVKPAHVRPYFPDRTIDSATDAVAAALSVLPDNPAVRRVLVTHQTVLGAARCESEEIAIGGTEGVDVSVFDGFDYVALGHLHGPQRVSRDTVRYAGTPLKYSFSEAAHHKSVTFAELSEKGAVTVRAVPLSPLHELREIRGSYMDLTAKACYDGTAVDDYLHITLTDEDDVPDALAKLRTIYPNVMRLDYDNTRTRSGGDLSVLEGAAAAHRQPPVELFDELYGKQNGQPMSDEQRAFAAELIEKIWEGGV